MAVFTHSAAAVILAGGRSSRMGRDKSRLILAGETLSRRAVDRLGALFNELVYVTNQPESAPWADNMTIVEDEVPFLGPLGGIAAGLLASEQELNFVMAVDMPFVKRKLIELLLTSAADYDVVVPRLKDGYEPLCAVYNKKVLPLIKERLKAGELRTISFYEQARILPLGPDKISRVDPEFVSFFNINNEADYQKARSMAEKNQ